MNKHEEYKLLVDLENELRINKISTFFRKDDLRNDKYLLFKQNRYILDKVIKVMLRNKKYNKLTIFYFDYIYSDYYIILYNRNTHIKEDYPFQNVTYPDSLEKLKIDVLRELREEKFKKLLD